MNNNDRMQAMASMFENAAETGCFEFDDKITYNQWLAFVTKHSKLKSIQFGKRDPAFVAELKRLAGVARSLIKEPKK